MTVIARWSGVPYVFHIEDGAGHAFVTDEPRPVGDASGPDPVDAFLGALCACSGTSVLTLLRKMRQRVDAFTVSAEGDRQATWPRAFTAIRLHFTVGSVDLLDEALVRKAVSLGVTRYCPIEGTLTLGRGGCAVTYDVGVTTGNDAAESSGGERAGGARITTTTAMS